MDFDVPDTTTRELVEAGSPETFTARRPLLALRGWSDRFVGACEAVFAPSAVVDAGAVAAFAALAAMPSDPDARSVAAAKYATVWIRRWEADICDSVVWNEPVESVSPLRLSEDQNPGARLLRMAYVGAGDRGRRSLISADHVTGGLSSPVGQVTATLLGLRFYASSAFADGRGGVLD